MNAAHDSVSRVDRPVPGWVLPVLVLLALGLRAWACLSTSLHLDDFHTLFHARAGTWGEFLLSARSDNHPPLFFAIVRVTRQLLGESELALRLPALTFGVAQILLVWRLARHAGRGWIQAAATLLLVASSLQLKASSDVRMYSLLALAVTGLLDGLLDLLEGRRAVARTAFWIWVGLLTHYHFVHAAVLVGPLALALAWPRGRTRAVFTALAAGAVLSLPWFLWGFVAQLDHGLAPGGSTVSPLKLVQAVFHLVYLNVGLAGDWARWPFAGVALVLFTLIACGLARLSKRGPAFWLLGTAALGLPAWSALVAWLLPRAGFEWRYLTGAIAPLCVLVAAGATTTWGRISLKGPFYLAALGALALAAANALDHGREDYRGAVTHILAEATRRDGVVALDWQPRIFPHSVGWNYYAPRLDAPNGRPTLIPHTDAFALADGQDLEPYERIFFLGRSIPRDVALLRILRERREETLGLQFGTSIWVLRFD